MFQSSCSELIDLIFKRNLYSCLETMNMLGEKGKAGLRNQQEKETVSLDSLFFLSQLWSHSLPSLKTLNVCHQTSSWLTQWYSFILVFIVLYSIVDSAVYLLRSKGYENVCVNHLNLWWAIPYLKNAHCYLIYMTNVVLARLLKEFQLLNRRCPSVGVFCVHACLCLQACLLQSAHF